MLNNRLFAKTFGWMFVGLLITFLTGYIVSINENMLMTVFTSTFTWISIIVELALVFFLSLRITKMQPTTAKISFMLYSFVSGLTFSSIFVQFKIASIMYVFLITAVIFGIFSVIGLKTNKDLTKMGTYLLMSLLAVVLASILNIFLGNSTLEFILSIVTIVIFMGYIAYDIKQLKVFSEVEVIDEDNLAILGALNLYLDFINIFIELISLLAENSD